MTSIERRDWRDNVYDAALGRRLAVAGCPLTVSAALADAYLPNRPLIAWVRTSLGSSLMLRTSQAEHLVAGKSLEWIAQTTGVSVYEVLYQLTRFEEDEAFVTEFYSRTNGGAG